MTSSSTSFGIATNIELSKLLAEVGDVAPVDDSGRVAFTLGKELSLTAIPRGEGSVVYAPFSFLRPTMAITFPDGLNSILLTIISTSISTGDGSL